LGLRKPLAASPLLVRVAPFVVFLALTVGQGQFGEHHATGLPGQNPGWRVADLEMRPFVSEMRWAVSWEAVVVGVAVFAAWVGISGEWTTQNSLWAKFGLTHPLGAPLKTWNPNAQFGDGSALAWLLIVTRMAGSTFIVPPLEEVFYRSFLYRYIAKRISRPSRSIIFPGRRFWPPPPCSVFHTTSGWPAFVRRGLSVAGDSQKPSGRCDDRARDHEFSARFMGRLARGLAFLVETSGCECLKTCSSGHESAPVSCKTQEK